MKRKFNPTFLMNIVMMMLFPLTMAAESVGYVVFNSENGTLTFKYGEKPTAGTNEEVYDLDAVPPLSTSPTETSLRMCRYL